MYFGALRGKARESHVGSPAAHEEGSVEGEEVSEGWGGGGEYGEGRELRSES